MSSFFSSSRRVAAGAYVASALGLADADMVWFCFLLALVLPMATAITPATARLAAAVCAAAGFVLMDIGGWLGGRLVYELGVGVKGSKTS